MWECSVHFENLRVSCWVRSSSQLRQQPSSGLYSTASYFARATPPFLFPLALYMVSQLVGWMLQAVERREDKYLKKLDDAKKKLIKDLKVGCVIRRMPC